MKGFPEGSKDTDREILLNIEDDKDLLEKCRLNKYFFHEVCDDIFFRNRLEKTYPDTLKNKQENESWKQYFLKTIYYIAKMKEKYEYNYISGNPKVQYEIFKESNNFNFKLIVLASKYGELDVVKEVVRRSGSKASMHEGLLNAMFYGHLDIVKYLVEQVVDVNAFDGFILASAAKKGYFEIVKYLVEHGANRNSIDKAYVEATMESHLDILKYLVEHGADTSIVM